MTPQAAPINTLADLMAGLQAAATQAAPVAVAVPGLGTVHVMPITTAEWLDPDQRALPVDATDSHKRAWSVARWVCDASGQRLIKPEHAAALDLFAALPWEASHCILDAAGLLRGDSKNA